MQNIDALEMKHRLCLNILEKMKIQQLLINEKKAYLDSYDKRPWYKRVNQFNAIACTHVLANAEIKLEALEREYTQVVKDMMSMENSIEVDVYERSFA